MPYYVYILKSQKNGKHYYGSCENIDVRLALHNAGKVKSTKPFIPYFVIYTEEYPNRSEAYRRELFFKSIDGYKFLKGLNIL